MDSDTSSASAILRKAAYLFLLVSFACFVFYVGAVQWNLDEPPQPIERVALALAIVAFVLGLVCIAGAGPQAFERKLSPEPRQRNQRTVIILATIGAIGLGLLRLSLWLRRVYERPGELQEVLPTLLPSLLLAAVTALVGGLAVLLLRSLARAHDAEWPEA